MKMKRGGGGGEKRGIKIFKGFKLGRIFFFYGLKNQILKIYF
jgi:hypothetical protein